MSEPTEAIRMPQWRDVVIPVEGAWMLLRGPFPITEEAWRQMHLVLDSMKPGLVQREPVEAKS